MGIRNTLLEEAINLVKFGTRLAGRARSADVAVRLAEAMAPVIDASTPNGSIHFFCPGKIPAYRARTLLTKEPETICWIDGFEKTDVFWDVGANVGVYSLYAALRSIVTVSFEPAAGNYYLLNRNIEINHMDDLISAFCIAFNDETRLDSFNMQTTEIGGALSTFAHAEDWQGNSFVPVFRQSMAGFTVDRFIDQFTPAFPNHIKVDVDGGELRIVRGARLTLSDKRVKSALIELDANRADYCNEVVEEMNRAGLTSMTKEHVPEFDHSQFSNCHNHIFRRGAAQCPVPCNY